MRVLSARVGSMIMTLRTLDMGRMGRRLRCLDEEMVEL